MATSRTGTAEWKKTVQLALHQAKAQGQRHCPYCQIGLNYTDRRAFNGAQVDHIVPHSKGGTNELANLVICCRTCNISKGNRPAPKSKTIMAKTPLKTSRTW
ncbi:HNH endonuclease [Glutamicibacter protophormiae]|uniref:HNH endonuclease n=1 Tax=Glutamicibacter protophormiae TaxID=37930 RepID=UPI003A956FCB